MKFPISMLQDFVETKLDADSVGELLTMSGFELEGIEEVEGEPVLDIKVCSNRGDGLSVFGLAREVLAKDLAAKPTALYDRAVHRFATDDGVLHSDTTVSIDTDACTRYACRRFEGLEPQTSPEWVQKRLRQAGMRPLGLVVDVTNYVMLEIGQPLHAFDADLLTGESIIVRQAHPGEKLTTLDGKEHELEDDMMMICDLAKPVAAAGIMGGLETEVTGATRNMLLESAHFVSTSVRRTRRKLGLSTEASYRFERSVDPDGVVAALNRFQQIYQQCGGAGRPLAGVLDVYPRPPHPSPITVRMERTNRLLGMAVDIGEAETYLSRLGMKVHRHHHDLVVTPPSWRPDIVREDDLIEEIGRIHGYDRIPEAPPTGATPGGGLQGYYALEDRIREAMLRCGFDQMVSHSLRDVHPLDFVPEGRVTVRNPHSPEMAYLRDSNLPSLADAARKNGGRDIHLFEIGKVFVKEAGVYDESPELAILSTGALDPPDRNQKMSRLADFFSLKGVIEEVARSVDIAIHFDYPFDPDQRFHPTRQAGVLVDEGNLWVGTMGQIHPDIADELDLPRDTFLAELDLLALAMEHESGLKLKSISRNPAVLRDISFLIEKSVPYATVDEAIRRGGGEVLERHWLFDVYEGAGVPECHHSLAIGMQLRKMGENFTDEEANQVRDKIVAELAAVGAKLR
ncbi:MAG: Phenylalanine--tRNA ligase beta subunit [Fimbriimonadaceae bacterium]|nr:Phenylalanine--tRNA ligase beta subunit [Fimbriimonadaceae bacterium]